MNQLDIVADLKSRGEKNIVFHDDGTITSRHGNYTFNTWIFQNGELKCIDCKTKY
jgi:hypothetical protein